MIPREPLAHVMIGICLSLLTAGCQAEPRQAVAGESDASPHLVAGSDIEAGRYLVILGGCNDCHTDGYLVTEGQVPESEWLMGSPVGWRGPWGTTYARNLRLTAHRLTEDQWVETLRTRKALPPMPWMNLNQISEADARALYRYIRSLGSAGQMMPAPVPPGREPGTPFISLMPVEPAGNQ